MFIVLLDIMYDEEGARKTQISPTQISKGRLS
jgi:hypothetical protein